MTAIDLLEAESIEILREACATAQRPAMLYSIGKDSSVMVHLAIKAFAPAPLPFPLVHIDTTWKFRDMYAHRDRVQRASGMRMMVHRNEDGVRDNVTPFNHSASYYTDVMKTAALRQALELHRFDVVFGGARRDEEASRAKERIVSVRAAGQRWDPKRQRPELWAVYNTRIHDDESLRVFPLSNWTEVDVWRYIGRERLAVVPLYFAAERPVVRRAGTWILVDDHRFPLAPSEAPVTKTVRFRTLGCYPLTGAIESTARTIDDVILETAAAASSERQGRLIDTDQPGSMERKKREGYF